MANLENCLIKVNKFINIDENRENYTAHYSKLRDEIFKILQENAVFKRLYKGLQLGGSYGDNLKVNMPDEFDLVFHIQIPESSKLKVKKDLKIPGNVLIDIADVLPAIEKQEHNLEIYKLLQKWTTTGTKEKLLLVEKLQSWLQCCFNKALERMNNQIRVNNTTSKIRYTRCGPAHTIYVTGEYEYSVDFVPGILLDKSHKVISKNRKIEGWEAIPKPLKPVNKDSVSFRGSYYKAEKNLIDGKTNLKNGLRMMKKFRDSHQNMSNLKSYYIKTLFLFKAETENNNGNTYWQRPLSDIVIDMFVSLNECLEKKRLQFYWDTDLNMFDSLTHPQLTEMHNCVNNATKELKRAKEKGQLDERSKNAVFEIFLNQTERRSLNANGLTTDLRNLKIN